MPSKQEFLAYVQRMYGESVSNACVAIFEEEGIVGNDFNDTALLGAGLFRARGKAYQESFLLNATPFTSRPDVETDR